MFANHMKLRGIGLFIVVSILFLMIGYTPYHHWDEFYYLYTLKYHTLADLIAKGNDLRLFPPDFFTSKIGSILIMWGLIQIFGGGFLSLFMIQGIFSLFLIGFFFFSYKIFSELMENQEASITAVIALFLPVTMYLSFKTLTEIPSLFFISLGIWLFLKSYRQRTFINACLFGALVTLCIGVFCRFLFVLTFAGLVVALSLSFRRKYPIKEIVNRTLFVGLGFTIFFIVFITIIHNPVGQLMGPLKSVITASRLYGPGIKLYTLGMYFQFFIFVVFYSVRSYRNPLFTFALLWFVLSTVPIFITGSGIEPRFLSIGLLPTAILIQIGLKNIGNHIQAKRRNLAILIVLSMIVIMNRFLFTPISLYQIDQSQFKQMVSSLYEREPKTTLITPWVTDYCFLRFVYPEKTILCSISRLGYVDPEFFTSETFRWWIGEKNQLLTAEKLESKTKPWIYIGRSFSPARERLYKYLSSIRLQQFMQRRVDNDDQPLQMSWIWDTTLLTRTHIQQHGPYSAYEITMTSQMSHKLDEE
jgi:hypothetical protein